jgi:hypothetical protein
VADQSRWLGAVLRGHYVKYSGLDLTDGVVKLRREPRPGAERSGCAAPGLGGREDTEP